MDWEVFLVLDIRYKHPLQMPAKTAIKLLVSFQLAFSDGNSSLTQCGLHPCFLHSPGADETPKPGFLSDRAQHQSVMPHRSCFLLFPVLYEDKDK